MNLTVQNYNPLFSAVIKPGKVSNAMKKKLLSAGLEKILPDNFVCEVDARRVHGKQKVFVRLRKDGKFIDGIGDINYLSSDKVIEVVRKLMTKTAKTLK
ncbi:MAG: hypothetical protein LBK53_05595 [Heliobacteriaceae bacterium]|jgi:hypothetical protein|nr:hypothetical protein [Heliobacteriaceae bacterium]